MAPNVDFTPHARVRLFLAPVLLSCVCYSGYVDLWTKKCKLVRVWTPWTWGPVDSVDSCGPVDSVDLWTCGLYGAVDSVDLWTL